MVNIIACRIRSLSVTEQIKIEELFQTGLKHYHSRDFFEAHEVWEELWSEYYLEDRKFIQGLIQLAVSFVHLGNGNMRRLREDSVRSEITEGGFPEDPRRRTRSGE